MTYQEFLQKLRETPRTWQCGTWLTAVGLRQARRGYETACPIVAVSGDKNLGVSEWPDAAKQIGLDYALADEIAKAADGDLMTPQRNTMRADLMRACGLLPDETPVPTDAQTSRFLASVRSLIDQPLVETE